MLGRHITLFTLFGFEVKLDFSWIFLALLISWSLATGYFPVTYTGLSATTYWAMGIAGALGLFFSIIFHEMSHSLVARQYGLPIRGITLFIFGGVAEMEEEPKDAKTEFLMAIAGPIASLLLALVFGLCATISINFGATAAVSGIFSYLSLINGVLALFNLVPAFPLDGGRVLRAALWRWKGDVRWATRIAARAGSGFGLVLIILGVLNILSGNFVGGMWWFLIGMFLIGAARGSYIQLQTRRAFEGETVARFMTESPVTVPPELSVAQLVDDYVYTYGHDMFPVLASGQLLGSVTIHDVKALPREEWASTQIGEIMTPRSETNTIGPREDALKALSLMQRGGRSRLMVADGSRLIGIVVLKDMLKLMSLKLDLENLD
ncbi:MAG TPA: site-2 protease family protein [Alphaproteobacteria bacterium]|nr:site-2 protease family protein [Alphaproteobacteria bacterium]